MHRRPQGPASAETTLPEPSQPGSPQPRSPLPLPIRPAPHVQVQIFCYRSRPRSGARPPRDATLATRSTAASSVTRTSVTIQSSRRRQASRTGSPSRYASRCSAVQRSGGVKSSKRTIPRGDAIERISSHSCFAGPPSMKRTSNGAFPFRRDQSPVSTSTFSTGPKRSFAIAARSGSASTVTSLLAVSIAEASHAVPTPHAVPVSPIRIPVRDAASKCSSRPTSGRHALSKPTVRDALTAPATRSGKSPSGSYSGRPGCLVISPRFGALMIRRRRCTSTCEQLTCYGASVLWASDAAALVKCETGHRKYVARP